ncbi:hypothetical protein [Vibrio mediterranei]|uniref:hypothetical protein n=1 Tax=Vibrio mediterranei TaxID=689 RepID=UPI002283AFAF|nr:hypothetical protein [Vibrio mediterranei]MCY9853345.1 hypothetical protein [Vibrio mediterranei]
MNEELQQKIEELLTLAKMQGVSIVGLVDNPDSNKCHVFKSIEQTSKQGTRNLDDIMMRQVCKGESSDCSSCHMKSPSVSDDGLAQLFSELQLETEKTDI